MKVLSLVIALAIVVSACGGSPTGPTGPTNPSIPSASNSASLKITPSVVSLKSVGASAEFTVSGGDGYNYAASDVFPLDAFRTEVVGMAQNNYRVRVTVIRTPSVSSAKLDVQGIEGSQLKTVSATINCR